MKVWDRAGIELPTPGSAVRLASVARHVTDCATRPGRCIQMKTTLFDLDLVVKVTQDFAQYPLHHVTISDTKFEVAMCNS